jgi:diguanylate cyclase (GGDEF)-like protein/PAS domain S-box-containing protein
MSQAARPAFVLDTHRWADFLPLLEPLVNSLECGVLIVDQDGRIAAASEALAALVGLTPEQIRAMTPAALIEHTAGLVDDPPERVRDGRLLAQDSAVVCEEFEIKRPQRAVVRWVARRIPAPEPSHIVVVTDITAEVDLTAAYERLALTDPLTGLTNRRGAEQVIRREIERVRRYGMDLSLVIFDVDNFKSVNDTHGHGMGDQILRLVATGIADRLRESDLPVRWGGEEFLVVLANTDLDSARICAERIRRSIAALSTPIGRSVTISGGVVQLVVGENLSQVIARADALLYEAKRAGRNRVM